MGTTIATCGGYELVEDGPRLVVVNRGTGAHDVALFVVGLLTFILSVNGVVLAAMAVTGEVPAAVPIGVGLGVAVVVGLLVLIVRARRRRKERAVHELPVVLVLDRAQGAICDRSGRPLAPLAGAVVRSAYQLGSSSKALEVACSAGVFTIARGSPFSGSVDDVADALRQRGFRVA